MHLSRIPDRKKILSLSFVKEASENMAIPIDFHSLKRHLVDDIRMADAFENETKRLPLKIKYKEKKKTEP